MVDNFHCAWLVSARLTIGYLKIDHGSIKTVWPMAPDLNFVFHHPNDWDFELSLYTGLPRQTKRLSNLCQVLGVEIFSP